jgi:hypothetical protein
MVSLRSRPIAGRREAFDATLALMWRPLLLHEIPGGDLRIFNTVDGSATSFPRNADAIARGEEFEFKLDTPLNHVIGTSCHIRLM